MSKTKQADTKVHQTADPTERLRRAELLLEISREVSALGSLDDILEALVRITTAELGAERGTLFLNDPTTGELYSRIAQGIFKREIRVLNDRGIAGHVFTANQSEVVYDVYLDARFNREIDEKTDFVTKSILVCHCVPFVVRSLVLPRF
jgi:adenylate cyclase